jgi:phage head maturation protease
VPIGSPVDIQAEQRGLRTVTRYNRSELADAVLEAIRNGDIRGYSFRGRIFKSNPSRIPRVKPGAPLPKVTRLEMGLTEYGPTPNPAYRDAGILAMRTSLSKIEAELAELVSMSRTITPSTPRDPDDITATPDPGPGAEDPRDAHSSRQKDLLRLKLALRERGM